MPALTDNLKGAGLMMCSMLAFLINDSCMKALSDEWPLMQAITIRGLGTSLILLGYAALAGGLRLRLPRRDWARIVIRSAAEVAAAYFFISALYNMPIANATAILQALPLAVTLAAALFFGEAVGWRRLTAIGVGFVGVMLIVRPGPEGFNLYSIYALISVVAVVVRDIATRGLSREVPSLTVAVTAGIGITLFGLAGSMAVEWMPVSRLAALQLAGSVVFVILGYITSILTMRVGEIGFTAQFRYTSLVFALISGLLVFGEWPDGITLLGCAIVVATGLFTLYRERGVRRPIGPAPLRPR
jgi:S-adenosylmethionine uptake transporter